MLSQTPTPLDREATAAAARRARALADPTRLTLAVLLAQSSRLSVGELAELSGAAPNVTSHHLGIMLDAGLLTRSKLRQQRLYAITEAGARLLNATVGEVPDRPVFAQPD
jgi:DNA-binding transcriptional ArsR family regulator